MQRPAFLVAISLLAGTLLARIVVLPAWVIGLALLAAVAGVLAVYRRIGRQRFPDKMPLYVLAVLAIVLGSAVREAVIERQRGVAEAQVRAWQRMGVCRIRGTVAAEPEWRGDQRERLLIVLDDVMVEPPVRGQGALAGADEFSGTRLGARMQVWLLRRAAESRRGAEPHRGQRVEVAAVPAPPPDAPHASLFDYGAFLRARGVGAQAFVWLPDRMRRLPTEDRAVVSAIFSRVSRARRAIIARIDALLAPERAALMRAILLGDTGGMPPRWREAFIASGLAHLFAVSGLHTALVAILVYAACRVLLAPRRLSAWIMVGCLVAFALVVGFRPSVLRAATMALFLAMPILTRRAMDHLQALSLAAVFTMLFDPQAPFRSDFQFSYLCTFGILTLSPVLMGLLQIQIRNEEAYRFRRVAHYVNRWLLLPLAVVLAAQLATIPLLSIYYHRVSLAALPANLLLLPLAGGLLHLGWLSAVLAPIVPAADGLAGPVLSSASGLFLAGVKMAAQMPLASVALPPFPWYLTGLYYVLLFGGPFMRTQRAPGARQVARSRFLLRAAGALAIVVWWPVLSAAPDGSAECVMLDVGEGDSIVLHLPNGRTMLVDTGPRGAADTVVNYLRTRNVSEIAALVLTHPDSDHVGGAPAVLDGICVNRVLISPHRAETMAQSLLDAALARHGVPVGRLCAGMRLRGVEPAEVRVLSPPAETAGKTSSNDLSIVLLAVFERVGFLLTGDAEAGVERDLLGRNAPEALQAQVLKVSHHGSAGATTAAFLDVVQPRIALISVGERNTYGHPAPATLGRLDAAGVRVFRTDRDGTIEVRTNGTKAWVKTYRSPSGVAVSP